MNELVTTGHDLLIRNLESSRSPGTRRQYEVAWQNYASRYGDTLPARPGRRGDISV